MIALILAALVQETVDNPEYKGWSSFKPGSTVTYTLTRDGILQEGVQKITLMSITEKEAALELEIIREDLPASKPFERQVPAKLPKSLTEKVLSTGEEEIEVGGKTLACTWKELEKVLSNGKTVKAKVWISAEIPGMAARIEGGGSVMNASKWEKK